MWYVNQAGESFKFRNVLTKRIFETAAYSNFININILDSDSTIININKERTLGVPIETLATKEDADLFVIYITICFARKRSICSYEAYETFRKEYEHKVNGVKIKKYG